MLGAGSTVERGYLYNDLKPENCIVTGDEFITLTDFGGVRMYWRDDASPSWQSEAPVFTAGYVSPEAVSTAFDRGLDPRSDVYSAGAMLWEMLSGVSPNTLASRDSPSITLSANDERLPAGLPESVKHLLARALAPDRDQRFRTAWELKQGTIDVLRALRTHV